MSNSTLASSLMMLGKKNGKCHFVIYWQNVMWKTLEEIILFYAFSGGPQLDKHILFKALFFRKFIGRIGEKLEDTNKKIKRFAEHHHCTKLGRTLFPYVEKV